MGYRVQLDAYHGPLDLLLYLIRRDEVDIHDIPIARITEQYLAFLDALQALDVELAGEFLVLAATLMEIKSALLLPSDQVAQQDEGEDLSDPRLELVRQLLQYKKYKDAASDLAHRADEQSHKFPRSQADIDRLRQADHAEHELDLESVQIWDLLEAFSKLLASTLAGRRAHQVYEDDTPIDIYEADILDRAQREKTLTFERVFQGRSNRLEIVGLFLALLELIRQHLVRAEQEQAFGPIYIFPLTTEPPEQAVAHAIRADVEGLAQIRDHHYQKHAQAQQKPGFAQGEPVEPEQPQNHPDPQDLQDEHNLDHLDDLDDPDNLDEL